MNKKVKISILLLMGFLAITSCDKKDDPITPEKEKQAPTPPAPTPPAPTPPAPTPPAPTPPTELKNTWVVESNNQIQYVPTKLRAEAGKPITLTLKFVGQQDMGMKHNLVILNEGVDKDKFVEKAYAAKTTDYIPESEKSSILTHTKLISVGQEDTITFTVAKKGTYQFLCTFPPHASFMTGELIIE